jgi:hypothetical protein
MNPLFNPLLKKVEQKQNKINQNKINQNKIK